MLVNVEGLERTNGKFVYILLLYVYEIIKE